MDFRDRKLPMSAANTLSLIPVNQVNAYELMHVPVYVFLKRNQKFISVKGPLDFFTPEELLKLKPYESFFLPKFIETVKPFKKAGLAVRQLLTFEPPQPQARKNQKYPPVVAGVSPYELSDAILGLIGSLWAPGTVVEPYFISIFVNELCEFLPGELLVEARNTDVERFENGIQCASWAVFLALHLGYNDIHFLNHLRTEVFQSVVQNRQEVPFGGEVDEFISTVHWSYQLLNQKTQQLSGAVFRDRKDRISQKMNSRLKRVEKEFILFDGKEAPSSFGPGGFRDV